MISLIWKWGRGPENQTSEYRDEKERDQMSGQCWGCGRKRGWSWRQGRQRKGVYTGRNPATPMSSEPGSKVGSRNSWERLRGLVNAGHSAQDTPSFPLPLVDFCSSFRSQLNHHLLQEALSDFSSQAKSSYCGLSSISIVSYFLPASQFCSLRTLLL